MNKPVNYKGIFKGLIIASCLALILYYFKSHGEEIGLLKKIGLADILLLFVLLLAVQMIHCYKLYLLVDPLGLKGVNFLQWFRIITVSRFVNQHVIQGAAFYRFIKLKKDYQFSYSNSLGLTVYYLWLETLSLILCTFLILFFLTVFNKYDFSGILIYLAGFSVLIFISPFVMFSLYKKIDFFKNHKLDENISKMSEAVFSHLKQPVFLAQYFLSTFMFIFVYMAAVGIGYRAVDIQVTFSQNLLYTIVLILTRMFNIVPANIGISELICGSISQSINVSFGSGIIISGIVRIINYSIYGLVTLASTIGSAFKGKSPE